MSSLTPPVEMRAVSISEYEAIQEMAKRIWPHVYTDLISEAQIAYMIDRMYAPTKIAAEVENDGILYFWITLEEKPIGYLAFGPVSKGLRCHLHKLYVLPSHHKRGIGSSALFWLIKFLGQRGVADLELRVNRSNAAAIRCYERNGFRKTKEDCLEIGEGFVMDDFIMNRSIAP